MRPQECVSGRDAYKARAQSPYQIWLATKVERAVERALQHEAQQILEEYVVSRKWVLPPICEERRLVTTKIHSLLLQWKPDFSAEWSLKLRRALPILEILFSHVASSKEDFSNPLLIEPHLKGVLSLLDSRCHNKSSPLWPIRSSTNNSLASYLNCFHHQCHHICAAEHIEAAEKVCACKSCLHVVEGRSQPNGQEACLFRSCLAADKGRLDVKGHEACVSPNLDEERFSEKTQKANSRLCKSCLHLEERFDTKAQNASVFGSCLRVPDELDEENPDDSLEWSKANLPSRGTVATLMASELRSSRKEEANQALWNALASKEVALLKDNLQKHGEFASKRIAKKIMARLKRSKKKEKHQRVKKVVAEQLPHVAGEEKICHAELPSLKMRRSLSKGLFGLFSCHATASEEHGLPVDPTPLPTDLEALESIRPGCLVCMHSKHIGGHAEKDDMIQAEVTISCSSNMISCSASSGETSTDDDNDDDNDDGSWHSIRNHIKSLHSKPFIEMPVGLVSNSTIINGSEKLTGSSSKDSDDGHSRMLSADVLACHHNVEVDITATALSSGYGCVDMQTDSVQSDQDSGDINSVDEDFGHTRDYDMKGSSMVSCSHDGDSESHGRSSLTSHDDDDGIGPLPCSSITNGPLGGKERACLIAQRENARSNNERREEGYMLEEADTGVKGRREEPPNCSLTLEEAYRGPCKTNVETIVDRSCNMMKPSSTKSIFSHINSDDQKLAEANMQTGSLYKDGERQEEGHTATSSNVPHGNEDESQVAEAPTELGATQHRDDEGQGQGALSHINSDGQKLPEANMQTGSLYKDGERQEEGHTATSSNVPQGNEDESQVAEAPTELGATRRRDDERQGQGAASRRRARVPLSSLLAEREDWSVQNTKRWSAWQGACPWDTWEEPNEALDPLCCVCMMGLKGAAFTPCGHTFCRKCSRELWNGRGTCPLCNKLITGILDIF